MSSCSPGNRCCSCSSGGTGDGAKHNFNGVEAGTDAVDGASDDSAASTGDGSFDSCLLQCLPTSKALPMQSGFTHFPFDPCFLHRPRAASVVGHAFVVPDPNVPVDPLGGSGGGGAAALPLSVAGESAYGSAHA